MANVVNHHEDDSPPSSSTISKSQEHYEANGNDMRVLLSMSIGLKDEDGEMFGDFSKDDRFPKRNKKKYVPTNPNLIDEIKRRKQLIDPTKIPKANSQMTKPDAIDWLQKNPLQDQTDVTFLLSKIRTFINLTAASEAEKTSNHRDQWTGIVPFLRLIHCIIDFDDIREAFEKHFSCLSREELDGRNNQETVRACPWIMCSDKWNDENYDTESTIYRDLHNDFNEKIDLSFEKIKNMGTLTADKARSKFFFLKNHLIVLKAKWDTSGNGDGSMAVSEDGNDDDLDETEAALRDANQHNGNIKANFLQGMSPAVLYLWEKAEEYSLLPTVCQQLSEDTILDSTNDEEETSNPRKKKRKNNANVEDEEREDLKQLCAAMVESNSQMKRSNTLEEEKAKVAHRMNLMNLVALYEERLFNIESLISTASSGWAQMNRLEKRMNKVEEKISKLKEELKEI